MRDFRTVARAIAVAKPELADDLEKQISFWAPELYWLKLSEYVNCHVRKNSADPKNVAVYAILCDRMADDIKASFEKAGY